MMSVVVPLPRSIHIPVIQPGELAPRTAPCMCGSLGGARLEEFGLDPRLVGLISPAAVVETLWPKISPSARAAFDIIDVDGSGSIEPNEVQPAAVFDLHCNATRFG